MEAEDEGYSHVSLPWYQTGIYSTDIVVRLLERVRVQNRTVPVDLILPGNLCTVNASGKMHSSYWYNVE